MTLLQKRISYLIEYLNLLIKQTHETAKISPPMSVPMSMLGIEKGLSMTSEKVRQMLKLTYGYALV